MSGGQFEDRQPLHRVALRSHDRISRTDAPCCDGDNSNIRRRKRFHRSGGAGSKQKARHNMPNPIQEVNGRVARSWRDFPPFDWLPKSR